MKIEKYLAKIVKTFSQGIATEHSYRGDLKELIEQISPDVLATNEPKRVKCGAPDYVVTRKEIPLGYIEAKDIIPGILDRKDTVEQIERYFEGGLGYNFVLTDYLEFRFFRDGECVQTIAIAKPSGKKLVTDKDACGQLEHAFKNYCAFSGQTISSSKKLASMMAAKAIMMRSVLLAALSDAENDDELSGQYQAFKKILMHDMTESEFADMYAQTITYGLFAARLNDPTLEDFSRKEAAFLLPKTNPFLRQLFGQIGAINLDLRIKWIVDDLVEVFRACNVKELLNSYGAGTKKHDPVIHFYEDFLQEYDPSVRNARGVWYTPEPVVDFIARATDEVLKRDFKLSAGLADTSKLTITVDGQGKTKKEKKRKVEIHRVQVLDPAVGTATFLVRALRQISSELSSMPALWPKYVDEDLIPRIHGFEILMAPYAMAHLKLDLVLRELGTPPSERLGVYLTNSLEEAHPDTGTLFAQWLSQESKEANEIKKHMPIMVVLGNPPYSSSSSNRSDWIQTLIAEYKEGLNEKKIGLDDDYIKFIRLAEYHIDKTGTGLVAMITNSSYLDGVTHRQMRRHLMRTFNDIYIFDLHGDVKKKTASPDGQRTRTSLTSRKVSPFA